MALAPEHYQDLKKSGLSDDTIKEAGIKSVPPDQINKKLGFNVDGLISMYEISFEEDYSRFKAFYENGKGFIKDGNKKPKYLVRKDSGNRLYIPVRVKPVLEDVSIPLDITEGEKKSLKGCQEGLFCIGITGLWNWKIKDENKLIPDFGQISLVGRTIAINPDNDWLKPDKNGERKNLKQAVHQLAYLLTDRGAKVYWRELPVETGEKVGLDDYLCKHSMEELKILPTHEIRKRQRKFSEGGKSIFKPLLEARIFKEGKHLIFLNQQILMYQDGWYQEFDDRYYLKLIEKQIEDSFNGRRNKAKEILDVLKDNLYKKTQHINLKPKLINARNGILNIDNFELLPHTPEEIFTYQINANYNPEAKCERFERFLKEVLVKEDNLEPDYEIIRIIQQYIGYCLYTKTPFHECMMLYGVGRNGKSVLVFVIIELFKGLISQVHFEDIGEDRFATADLAGKLVNVSSEFGVNARISDGRIKGIIAGDELRAQRKHQPAFDFRPFAKHIITTNNLPRSRDKSLGFFSRFKIIPFHRIFLEQKEIETLEDDGLKEACLVRDTFLEPELKKELDGIFLWAVYGLKDLLKNKGFCHSEQVEKLKNTFKVRCSSIESFMDERADNSDCMANIELPKLYREYILYCKEYQIPPEPKRRFDSSIKDLGFEIDPRGQGKRFVLGVKLKE
ncbi:MAG: ATPase [Candidatus Scalindua rubra]|uniref:ATPase n=1 Tax=Candidatus Scalindua rubra TaxID=1872076 RepID=A0A1E3XFV6_9BACT|nr:MAG: ATPase [Candidatus Scalindua rubra]